MRATWLLVACLSATIAHAESVTGADERGAVRNVIEDQVAAWNRHDLVGYMAGYWKSPELTFYAGGTVSYGWQAALDRYRQRYQAAGKEMGHLMIDGLLIEPLSDTTAFVRGRFALSPSGAKGLFTLVFRKLPAGWKIVHDHSSAN